MAEITMPKMGFDMQEGTIVRWLKKSGDEIKRGEPIAEIETDKVTIEIEAFDSGVLGDIVVQPGQTAPVNSVIAHLLKPGEAPAAATPAPSAAPQAAAPAPAAQAAAPVAAPVAEEPLLQEGEVRASPVAKRIARENGVDLRYIAGTGPNGRIVREDVEKYITAGGARGAASAVTREDASAVTREDASAGARGDAPAERLYAPPAPTPAAPAPAAPAPVSPSGTGTLVPLTNMRKTITRRLSQSWQQIPHIFVSIDIDMGAALDLRKQANAGVPKEQQISVNDMVVKACASALPLFPNINASFTDEGVVQHTDVNIAIAIALEVGLVAPVISGSSVRSIGSIARESKRLQAAARDGKLVPADLQGATFTVSNLGMYGIVEFTSIITPPQAGILSIGATQRIPAFKGDTDEVVAKHVMRLTVAVDHRTTDGAEAARFLNEIKRLLENPLLLLVG